MASKVGQLKPFYLEEKKEGPSQSISDATFTKWQGSILSNIRKEDKWTPFISRTWSHKKEPNRGFTSNTAEADSKQVDLMLAYIAQYAPSVLYRDITQRSTSLESVWTVIRQWAGLKSSGCKHYTYYQLKENYEKDGDVSHNDFFFSLRNAKEDCLLLARENGGKVKFNGTIPTDDEDLTPTLESDIVIDWLHAIGGSKLVDHVFRAFSKELETESLSDIRQRIAECLPSLLTESDIHAELKRASISESNNTFRKPNNTRNTFRRPYQRNKTFQNRKSNQCSICVKTNPQLAYSHSVAFCPQLTSTDKKLISRFVSAEDQFHDQNDPDSEPEDEDINDNSDYAEDEKEEEIQTRLVKSRSVYSKIKINKVSITESPILAASYCDNTIYLVLDTGATASLISLRQAQSLNLKIYPTSHKAIQVDGESDLPIIGEVHTTFKRGSASLKFNALVVKHLSVDILAGTSFHKENDVFSRMSKGTIHIGDEIIVQSTPPALLTVHEPEPKTKHFLVQVMKTITILPGDVKSFSAPTEIRPNEVVMIEPNINQCEAFFEPSIVQLDHGRFQVTNTLQNPVTIKKHNAAIVMYTTKEVPNTPEVLKPDKKPISPAPKTLKDIMKEVKIDGNLPSTEKDIFKNTISQNLEVFQPNLPGYNGAYGQVFASFEFASKTRPLPQKLRLPNYGSIQDSLFNLKCQELEASGVIIDPLANEIQPALTHNAWVVKKPSSSHKSWDQCETKDVRLVVGLDPLNKFLKDPPGKVTKTEQVFSSIAGWQFLGEIDFSDCYFQIPFNQDSRLEKLKLGYLCIRTARGTRCFARATMGLLGMDVYQDELTDRIFGDLVLSNHVSKLADNIYFGANTLTDFQRIFHTILQRCKESDLRIKPSKVSLNVQDSDILGLHWQKGKLSPSQHKLDPLAECDPPQTVRGLRSWLGGVRFNEICLPGSKIAAHSKPLDDQVPSKRSGKDSIEWTATLLHAFRSIQSILKQPISVTVPREGDVIYMATDACTSLPAGGTKIFIKRPGIDKFLPSFNFGARLPTTVKNWYPCEVEAFFLNKGIEKAAHYVRVTNNPAIALTDCKPVYQAKLKLDDGKFSASPKLQSLLTNLSAKRFSIQLLSAKLPSPILKMVDFNSRHPPKCDTAKCSICKDMSRADIFAVNPLLKNQDNTLMSVPAWRMLQQSCSDLTKAHALLAAGKPLQNKSKEPSDVKFYLNKCSIDKNGLIIVKKAVPWKEKPVELLVIPRQYGFTFVKAFHNKMNHPNPNQMKNYFQSSIL